MTGEIEMSMSEEDTQKLMQMVDPSNGFPVLTNMLYRVCRNNPTNFEEGCRLLLLAYESGRASALQDAPAPAPPARVGLPPAPR